MKTKPIQTILILFTLGAIIALATASTATPLQIEPQIIVIMPTAQPQAVAEVTTTEVTAKQEVGGRSDINIIDLARIMQGESTGDKEAAYYVGWVAKNRLLHESYGDTYAIVSSGFFGYKASTNPNDDFIEIAMRITQAREDPTDGCLYAFSRTDITNLGIPPSRADVTKGEWFFFKTWPLSGR